MTGKRKRPLVEAIALNTLKQVKKLNDKFCKKYGFPSDDLTSEYDRLMTLIIFDRR